ncbi:sensor histidine kinase [Dactylosporangium sp. NPDC000521]|uniref:sensor histidine kinase n=1 Tax=Dactylosporangium sp. NPDC000521 TaxID=3363975 RepID=UPI0036BE6FB0
MWVDLALYATLIVLYAVSGTVISVPLAVAQLLPLVWRRRFPGAALAVISAATAAHSLLGMGRAVGYLPVSLAMYTAATHRSPALRWGVCGAAAAVVTVAGAVRRGPVEGGLLAAVALIITWLAGYERGEHQRERAEHIRQTEAGRTRERLARRLHDSLAHTMTVMLVQGEALKATAKLDPDDRRRLDTVLQAGRDALTEVRQALAEEAQRDATLPERLAALRAAGLAVPTPPDLTRLPEGVRELADRLVAEAATNALRHDGPGTTLHVASDDASVVVTTHRPEHARPAATTTGGYGLRSLDADVRAAGGTLTYGPTADGWQVRAAFTRAGDAPAPRRPWPLR